MSDPWFPEAKPRSDWEWDFVGAMRRGAVLWPDIAPSDGTAHQWRPLVLSLAVPEVPTRSLIIEACPGGVEERRPVLFGPDRVINRGPTVFGFWDEGPFHDDFDPRDPESLVIQGVEASATQYGSWASDWVGRQLARPLSLLEWESGQRRWVFEDTGWTLWREGQRLRRREPSAGTARRTVLRGGR